MQPLVLLNLNLLFILIDIGPIIFLGCCLVGELGCDQETLKIICKDAVTSPPTRLERAQTTHISTFMDRHIQLRQTRLVGLLRAVLVGVEWGIVGRLMRAFEIAEGWVGGAFGVSGVVDGVLGGGEDGGEEGEEREEMTFFGDVGSESGISSNEDEEGSEGRECGDEYGIEDDEDDVDNDNDEDDDDASEGGDNENDDGTHRRISVQESAVTLLMEVLGLPRSDAIGLLLSHGGDADAVLNDLFG
jgi:hypothetical protein